MYLKLEDFVDIEHLQALFERFYSATGIAASIIALDGTILVGSGWQKICTEFHRKNPESEKLCIQSDTKINEDLITGAGLSIYQCPHGLIDAATPIIINQHHVANLFTGQFLFEAPNKDLIDEFDKQAQKWGFDRKRYLQALKAVPVIPEERVRPILHYLKQFSEMIGKIAYNHLRLKGQKKAIDASHSMLENEIIQREKETCKLTQILEGSPFPTFVIDSECKITHWNHACEELTATPAAGMIGTQRHRDVIYAERRPLMADLMVKEAGSHELSMYYGSKFRGSRLINDGYEGTDFFPNLGKNGKWLFFTAAPIKDVDGNILGAIEILQDVTDKYLAEHELRASESRYRHLFESANDAIFILKDGAIIDCNQKALTLLSAPKNEIVGRSVLELSPEYQPSGHESKEEIKRKTAEISHDQPQIFEWQIIDRDACTLDVEVSLTKVKVCDTSHGLAIVRDITERKEMLKTLKHREKELHEKTRYLEKVNQALKASLDHREIEKRAVEQNILVNLKRFVFPYLEELNQSKIPAEAKAFVNIINTNLNDIIAQSSNTVFAKYLNFTPNEVRIADLIREGKNTKDIAHLLGLSPSSVQWHRKNIREKLELTNKKVNLHTYLNSLTN